ncbi:MAG TPA: ComEC/Rec2 family competence protein [Chitinophagaceae bacterium]|nr:ComEC/Rec2 family competence protein [Chitinophagaceae bacterium]
MCAGFGFLTIYILLPFFKRYQLVFFNGFAISIIFFSLGALLTFYKDVRNHPRWMGRESMEESVLIANVIGSPVEKTKSYKVIANLGMLGADQKIHPLKGRISIYIKKSARTARLSMGARILFKKALTPVRNTGNPGAFDFKRFSVFHGITHQVYLDSTEYLQRPGIPIKFTDRLLCGLQEKILSVLRKNIHSSKELGLAEALLIGYKEDLDPDLVQSYANSGVVHIIAISGLHLGLIYLLLLQCFKPIKNKKKLKYLKPVFIISILWLFSFLTGAQPSILRSALMFSCMILGESLGKRNSIYNTLSCSAFLLLCINPFWLWDLGFQLSYSAILGIVIFMRPIYQLVYFRNKLVDHAWKAISVTLAAQLLSLPFCIYYFHQFPNYFLITNLVAVPLSSLILFGEILLCALSFIPFISAFIGKVLAGMIGLLNAFIERMDTLPFSRWEELQVSIPQAILLLIIITAGMYWLMNRSGAFLKISLGSLLFFLVIRSVSDLKHHDQSKIIVYDIPRHRAMDIIDGNKFRFYGDPELERDELNLKYNFKPSRLLHRLSDPEPVEGTGSGSGILNEITYINFDRRHILLLDGFLSLKRSIQQPVIDLLVVSGRSTFNIPELFVAAGVRKFVFDSSVPPWKLKQWKRDCDSLHIAYHDINEKGAFVISFR